ncbi:MAG: ECF transporter S component [Lachnospiraceae bacterium]|nr:ECF transporter S component [Lachnospiraceae bacterium]
MDKTTYRKKNFGLSFWISIIIMVVCIPATIGISYLLGDRKLYIGSVIIMILAMIPFFVSFEGSKPEARYLAILAVLTAIAVVSRVAFIWLPSFKPMAGVIIMTAIAFGPQAGFMSGALSMIISNIIFGQGPWTPWQMFCYGLIGFVAGLLANARIFSEKHLIRTSIISFILVTVLSSAVLDTCSLFYMTSTVNEVSAISIYAAGIVPNMMNALASTLCVFILLKPFMAILNRLKQKYGINY